MIDTKQKAKYILEDYANCYSQVDLEQLAKYLDEIKAEAYKECIAKIENYVKTHCNPYGKPNFDYNTSVKILNYLDNLLKELEGDNNG